MSVESTGERLLRARFLKPGECWRTATDRVASELSETVGKNDCKEILQNGYFVPSGQVWRGAGDEESVLLSCFVIGGDAEETGADIAHRISEITRQGCGVGVNLSTWKRRRKAARPYMNVSICNAVREIAISQQQLWESGIRRTATMVNVNLSDPEVIDASALLTSEPIFRHLNLGVLVPDKIMARSWQSRKRSLRSVDPALYAIAEEAWRTGNPGVLFEDRINDRHPFENERIDACNPCGEQHLLPDEGCNLGTLNLAAFVQDGQFDWDSFSHAAEISVAMLDSVIDVSNYPSSAARDIANRRRRIGLGVCGLASALHILGIPYEHSDSIAWSEAFASCLSAATLRASAAMAKKFNSFPDFNTSGELRARRNWRLLSLPPTGASSLIWGVSPGIEPFLAVDVRKQGVLFSLRHSKQGTLPKTAPAIPWAHQINVVAAWQKFVDGGISKTVALPMGCTVDDVVRVFATAWKQGCKGITVYRS